MKDAKYRRKTRRSARICCTLDCGDKLRGHSPQRMRRTTAPGCASATVRTSAYAPNPASGLVLNDGEHDPMRAARLFDRSQPASTLGTIGQLPAVVKH